MEATSKTHSLVSSALLALCLFAASCTNGYRPDRSLAPADFGSPDTPPPILPSTMEDLSTSEDTEASDQDPEHSVRGRPSRDDGYVLDRRLRPRERIVYRQAPWAGSVSFMVGGRALTDENFWGDHDDVAAVGVEVELHKQDSIFGLEFGVTGFTEEEEEDGFNFYERSRASMVEAYFGPRMTFDLDGVRPYLGGGASFISIRQEYDLFGRNTRIERDEVDEGVAAYVHTGVQVDLTPHMHIGFDVRGVFGSQLQIGGNRGDADYVQASLMLGANW